jgi:hypothetical protein
VRDHTGNAGRAADALKGVAIDSGQYGVGKSLDKKACRMAEQDRQVNGWNNEKGEWVVANGCYSIGGKTFYAKQGVLQDLAAGEKADEEVRFYSDEFFALLDRNPELGKMIALNQDVMAKVGDRTINCKK